MLRSPARNYHLRVPTNPYLKDSPKAANRRVHCRQKLSTVVYIDLGPSNGGLVLNLSETGLALSAAMKLMGDELPNMRFKLPGSDEAIEAQARIVWMSESKKEAGVQFEQLPESDARKISEWITAEQDLNALLEEAAVSDGVVAASSEPTPQEPAVVASEKAPAHSYQAVKSRAANGVSTSAGRDYQERGFLGSQAVQDTVLEEPLRRRKWGPSAAAIALIALVSFGIGVTIERRLQHEAAKPVDAAAATAKAKDDRTSAGAALPAAERPSAENDPPVVQRGMAAKEPARKPADANAGPQVRVPVSERQGTVSNDDNTREGHGNKGSGRQNGGLTEAASEMSGRDTSRKGHRPNLEAAATHLGAGPSTDRADGKQVAAREIGQKRSPAPLPDSASIQRVGAGASAQNEARTTPAGTPLVNTAERAAPRPVSTPPTAKAVSPSVAISMPPFPSMRIPPELKSQASRVGTALQMGQLLSRIEPAYPPEAVRQEIAGTVKLHAAIGRDGAVQSVEANGPALLAEAAMSAVRRWRYKPTLLDGQAIEADEEIVFVFRLSPANP